MRLASRPALALAVAALAAGGTGLATGVFTAEATPTATVAGIDAQGVDHAQVWILSGTDEYEEHFAPVSTKLDTTQDAAGQTVVLSTTTADQIPTFHAHHEAGKRCPGFRSFPSRQAAEEFMANDLTKETVDKVFAEYTIDNDATVTPWLGQVDHTRIRSTIEHLSTAYPNRYYSSRYGKQAASWVRDTWAGLAAGRDDVTTELFTGCSDCGGMPDVVMTVKGAEKPDEIVVIGGHMDSISKTGKGDAMKAPGADDDASGTATVTEIARVALQSGWKPKRTVVFAGYAAEEVGLRGSAALAKDFRRSGKNVVAALQLDMTNYDSHTGTDIAFMTDNVNGPLTAFGKQLFDHYLAPLGLKRGTYTCNYACSDHASWTSAGYPSMMTAEPVLFPKLHTTSDTLASVGNTAKPSEKYAKMGLAFLGELAKTSAPAPTPTPTPTVEPTVDPTPEPPASGGEDGKAPLPEPAAAPAR